MYRIFIDGSAGTTGLRIRERLSGRPELELIALEGALRKDPSARREALNGADVAILCLPDDAAREAVSMIENPGVAVIDTSTAHRTAPGWTYGFPELQRREALRGAKRVANPGCHASGFIALVAPLVRAGLLSPASALCCTSLTGYSGGGRRMIEAYEAPERDALLGAPRLYGLNQRHKHLPEMAAICGLEREPAFLPVVADYYSGMEVLVPLAGDQLNGTLEDVKAAYRACYAGPVVRYVEDADEAGFLSAAAMAGRDDMQVSVLGNADRPLLAARFDNLGKGASGAAIQNLNLLLGLEETAGLVIGE